MKTNLLSKGLFKKALAKLTLAAMVSLGCVQGAQAQTIMVGNNSGNSQYYPIYNYYGYSYSQSIYLASEIAAAGGSGPAYITAIKYFYNTAGTPTNVWNNWDVAMANTSTNAFVNSTSWISGLNTVYSGTINIPPTGGQWLTIPLSTPFLWDGTSNIVVSVHETVPGYASPYSDWRNTVVGAPTDYRSLLYYDDTNNPNPSSPPAANQFDNSYPDIQFSLMSTTACAGAPPASTAIASYSAVCGGTSIDLDLGASFMPAPGETYQWQSSPNGTAWTNIGSSQTTAPYTVSSQSATTYYRCVVTCTNGGAFTASSPVTVNQNPFTACYCTPSPIYCGNGDQFTNVQFGFTNDYPACNGNGYTDQTAVPASSLTAGSAAYPIFVNIGASTYYPNDYAGFWIDYDHSGSFDPIEYTAIGSGVNTTLSGAINVPFTALPGLTHMRLLTQGAYSPITNPDPCNTGGYGEVVDYSVYITPAAGCTGIPAAGSAQSSLSNVCPNTAITLTLTGSSQTSNIRYQWQSSPNGTAWTNLGGSQTFIPYSIQSQTTTMHYRCVLTCTTSAQTSTSTPVVVTQNAPTACYCTPANYYCGNESISNFTFQSINDNPVCGANGYIDQTGTILPPTISANQSYTLMLAVGTNSPGLQAIAGLWMDFDANGIFDASEYTFIGSGTSPTYTASVSIPFTAVGGSTRMRVALDANFSPVYSQDPCNATGSYGMAIDYLVNINPMPACNAAITGGTTTVNSASVCANSSVKLDLAGNSLATGISYQWQSSPNGTAWTNLGAPQNTVPYELFTQTTNTYYRCVLTCTAAASTATSVAALVAMNSPTLCYCVNPSTDCTSGDEIINVILANMTNTSTCSTNGYEDYTTTVPSATVAAGATYTLITETSSTYDEYVSVWIDFDHNGTFDQSEYTFLGSSNGSNDTIQNTITIPASALTGDARMRVRTYYYQQLQDVDACNSPTPPLKSSSGTSAKVMGTKYGETEDYLVTITPPSCTTVNFPPSVNATASSPTACASSGSVTLDLSWSAPSATGITYQWSMSTDAVNYNPVGSPVSTSSISVAVPQTAYFQCDVLCNGSSVVTSGTVMVTSVSPNVMASANPSVVCSAENSILTATGAVTYTWSSGVTLSIDTVNPVAGSTPSVTIYSVSGSDANGCAATATVSVLAKPSTAISGTVSATSGAVGGYVVLYKYEPFLVKFDSTDYTNIQANGTYNFPSVNSTTYIVKAVPSAANQQITYAPNVISWQNATPLTHSCVVSSITNIQVQTLTVLAAGTGSLSGRVKEGIGYVHKSADGGEKPMAPGNPIPGVVVKGGKNPGAQIFAQTVTDAQGMYAFSNLPPNSGSPNDDYFILVDIPGLDTNGTYYRKLTVQVNSYDSLNFVVDNQYVNPVNNIATSVNDINIADNEIKVFPNPANAFVTVEYSLLKQSTVRIELLDVVGKNMKLVQAPALQAQGSYSQTVPIDMLSPGMYFMKLYIDGNEATVKLCITR